MENNSFVKIEDREMPVCNLKDIDLETERNFSYGFTNFVFLAGIVFTSIMWIILIYLGR